MERWENIRIKFEGREGGINEDHLPRLAYEHQRKGRRRGGRQHLRWFDSSKRETKKTDDIII